MPKFDNASIKMAMRQDGGRIWDYKDIGRSVLKEMVHYLLGMSFSGSDYR
jgi:hypothetical protein